MVELGAFRTKIGDSFVHYPVHPAYAEPDSPAQQMRAIITATNANNPGDPDRAAAKIYQLAGLDKPPVRIALGDGVVDYIIQKLDAVKDDIQSYRDWSENEQNVKNLKREKVFLQQIQEYVIYDCFDIINHTNHFLSFPPTFLISRKNEDAAWAEVLQFYNTHQSNVLASIEKDKRQQRSQTQSSKAKGKARTSSVEPELFDVRSQELPEKFLGPEGYDVARTLLEIGVDGIGKGTGHEQNARIKVRLFIL